MFSGWLLVACQDYSLQGGADDAGKYNPPDLGAEWQVDEITQVTVPSVDVLWVIDDSCSMEEEQRALRDNFPAFMRYFTGSGLDYHVGVTSTDMGALNPDAGRLIADDSSLYIDATVSEAEAEESFRARATLGTGGSGTEQGKDAVIGVVVTNQAEDQGFYRDDADLSVIVISDERDYSDITVNEFTAWALGLKPDRVVYFSSIVGDGGCASAERGTGYIEVTESVGGILWDICTDDWSGLLAELGLLSAGLDEEFFLSLVPVESTLEVSVRGPDGAETPYAAGVDWVYDRTRNSVAFLAYTPEPLAVVRIEYQVLASSTLDSAG